METMPVGRWTWSFLAVVVANAVLHVAVRLLVSDSAELDESEQLLLTQSVALGYTAQPPLYTWLQAFVFAVTGLSIFSLAWLKNLLLLGTALFLFLTGRRLLGSPSRAALAALALWLLPQFAWEPQRDLTHSVLVTSLAAATLYVAIRLRDGRRTVDFAILGVLLGLGSLSKYSFLLFAAALFVALLGHPAGRTVLVDRRLALALGIAALLVLPHAWWLSGHWDRVTTEAATRLWPAGSGGRLLAALGFVGAGLGFVLPLAVVWLAVFWPSVRAGLRPGRRGGEDARLLERFFGAGLALVFAGVLLFGVTNVKDRWLAPLLFPLPLYLFLRLRDVPVTPVRQRAFACVLALAAVAALGGRLAQAWVGPSFGIYTRLSAPFTELAGQIGAAGFAGGTIVADSILLGGNLRLAFPAARVLTPEHLPAPAHPAGRDGQCLVVWKSDRDLVMPAVLEKWLAGMPGTNRLRNGTPRSVVAPRKHQADRPYRLAFLLSTDGAGGCT